jgi:hypothetical protein
MPQRLYAVALALAISVCASAADAKPLRQQQLNCDNNGRCISATAQPAERVARSRSARANRAARTTYSGAGVVRSGKTGATAFVDPKYAGRFQAYIDDLENNYGARIVFMGGGRGGRCGLANQHACGGGQAVDVCQYSWGVVDRRCGLPSRGVLAKIARNNGLYEGAEWCRPDTGHVQVRFSGSCRGNLYAAVSSFKTRRDTQ